MPLDKKTGMLFSLLSLNPELDREWAAIEALTPDERDVLRTFLLWRTWFDVGDIQERLESDSPR